MKAFARHAPMLACILGLLGVLLGAFGAHALEERVSEHDLDIWERAVFYHLVHAVVMLYAGHRAARGHRLAAIAALLHAAGIIVFSGSLYTLVLTGVRTWGAVTPIGGVSFIVGWIVLGLSTRGISNDSSLT